MDLDNTAGPEKVPSRIQPEKPLGADQSIRRPEGSDFQSYMKPTSGRAEGAPASLQSGEAANPMQVARGSFVPSAPPTVNSLLTQARNAQDTLGHIDKQLKEPNLRLKRSQAHLLRNKLGDANAYTRAAAGKLGIDTPPMKGGQGSGPLSKFLALIGDGQDQMVKIQKMLEKISASGGQLNPGDMLLVQVKMGLAQQELEYSSTLLGKVVDSIKQLMNVQL